MKKEISVGLLGIISLALLIWGYYFIKGSNILSRNDVYLVDYHNIQGLEESNQVVWRGMAVGIVKSIKPTFSKEPKIQVTLELNTKLRLPQGTQAILTSDGIMGGKIVRLGFDQVCQENCLKSGDFLIPASEGMLGAMLPKSELEDYMTVFKNNVGDIVDSLKASLDQEEDSDFKMIMRDIKSSMNHIQAVTTQLDHLLRKSSDNLVSITTNIADISEEMAKEKESIRKSISNIEKVTANLAESPIDSTVVLANQSLQAAKSSMQELDRLMTAMQNEKGTLGKLLQDESLYNNLNNSSRELDLLLQDFRLNPKRYVNVSVFGKKQKEYELPEEDPAQPLDSLH